MKIESQLPRFIALALLVLFVLLACTGVLDRSSDPAEFQGSAHHAHY